MKNKNFKFRLSILILLFLSNLLFAQLSDEKIARIDSLFLAWDAPNHPGASVGIVQNDKVVYAKAFGLASLEYKVPNTFATRYNVASVSKQFTAFGIALLHVQGKLSVNDDIRQYLPELPDFGHKITIRHMLHHISGLRSLHSMLALAGWRKDDSRTNADLLRFIINQKGLNFVPGAEYMYCNTGYILMSEIIERVTGKEFNAWMKANIFEPFGMYNTYVEEFYDHVVDNNATSYIANHKGDFKRSVEYWGYVGSGNIHTNVPDLLKWLKQLCELAPQWKNAIDLMKTKGVLNNGDTIKYAFGINIDKYKGENRIYHDGSIGGFRSHVCTFPDRKTDIVVLTNFSSSSPSTKVNAIADILFDKKPSTEKEAEHIKFSNDQFDKLSGRYKLEGKNAGYIDIFRIGDTFYALRSETEKIKILPLSEKTFVDSKKAIKLNFAEKDSKFAIKAEFSKEEPSSGTRIKNFELTKADLDKVSGIYWSPELETQYKIVIKEGKLQGYHPRHVWFDIRKVRDNEFNGSPSFFIFFTTKFDEKGNVIGIFVTNSRARNVWFKKTR